jgi:hypothetical protein
VLLNHSYIHGVRGPMSPQSAVEYLSPTEFKEVGLGENRTLRDEDVSTEVG